MAVLIVSVQGMSVVMIGSFSLNSQVRKFVISETHCSVNVKHSLFDNFDLIVHITFANYLYFVVEN